MPLTDKEQRVFEALFTEVMEQKSHADFLEALGDVLLECTGNVNLKMRLSVIALNFEEE